MNKINVYLLTFLLLFTCHPFQAQVNSQQAITTNAQGDDIFYHTIERGQTVYSIATMYGVSVEDIHRLNPGSEEGIKAGDRLRIPQRDIAIAPIETDESYTFHTIQPKETLYSLSIRYNVPATDIIRANPGLSVETFRYGQTIRIPATPIESLPSTEIKTVQKEMEYTVGRRETLYRISRKFDISTAELIKYNPQLKDGLKAGMILKIPVETQEVVTEETVIPSEREVNALLTETKPIERVESIQVALLLPFTTNDVSARNRFVEYYEGMLMAADSLRKTGCKLEISVFDTGDGTQKINQILTEDALKNANLIIGAVQNDQIKLVADFAREHEIKYIIPFTSRNDDVLSNAYVYQVNTPHSYLYAKAAQAGCELFANDNIIIVRIADSDEQTEFIQTFKTEMAQRSIPFKEVTHNPETFTADLQNVLESERRNIVLPTSDSLEALNKIRAQVRMLAENTVNSNTTPYNISLMGYPKWQTFTREALEDFYALNTYIYSHFYADVLSPEIKQFYADYKNWYSKNLINTFPKYGILGFDTAMFFFDALKKYGENFESNIDKIHYKSLQTGFNFERVNNWGGFINTNVFIVQYRNDFTVVRNEIR